MFKSTCPSESFDHDKLGGGYGGKNDDWSYHS